MHAWARRRGGSGGGRWAIGTRSHVASCRLLALHGAHVCRRRRGIAVVAAAVQDLEPAGQVGLEEGRPEISLLVDSEVQGTTRTALKHKPAGLSLRGYQDECVEACLSALDRGVMRMGVSSPTGSGKTTIFAALIANTPSPRRSSQEKEAETAKQSLVIVNSIELARQASQRIRQMYPHLTVEIEQGSQHVASGFADATVATIQTLISGDRLDKFDPERMKLIVIDEAHHAAAPSYIKALAHFHVFSPSQGSPEVPLIGFSATFSRHDGVSLGSVFQEIVFHKDWIEMAEGDYLAPLRFTTVKTEMHLEQVTLAQGGDYALGSLGRVMNRPAMNDVVMRAYLDKVAATRKTTLVFATDIAHATELTRKFREIGVDARSLTSLTERSERLSTIVDFLKGVYPVLINCAILTEGADLPAVDCVILARPTRSRNLFSQMIGRGMRLSPETGKKDCLILDFVDNLRDGAYGLVCTPALYGLDVVDDDVEDQDIPSLQARAEARRLEKAESERLALLKASQEERPKSITYTEYESALDLEQGDRSSSSRYLLKRMSQNAWVHCGNDVFVLELLGEGCIKIEPTADCTADTPRYQAFEWRRHVSFGLSGKADKSVVHHRKVSLSRAPFESLEVAIRACDTRARQTLRGQVKGLWRSAPWRSAPASKSQVEALGRIKTRSGKAGALGLGLAGKPDGPGAGPGPGPEPLAQLSKGEAAELITRLKHGALKRGRALEGKQRLAQAKAEREDQRRERETVRVGPMAGVTPPL